MCLCVFLFHFSLFSIFLSVTFRCIENSLGLLTVTSHKNVISFFGLKNCSPGLIWNAFPKFFGCYLSAGANPTWLFYCSFSWLMTLRLSLRYCGPYFKVKKCVLMLWRKENSISLSMKYRRLLFYKASRVERFSIEIYGLI